jgi:hypothetical protein
LRFIVFTPSGAEINSRFKALEIVSTTVVWLADKEQEIYEAFSKPRSENTPLIQIKNGKSGAELIASIKQWIAENDTQNRLGLMKH